jgi:hypothetical protein
VRVDKEVDSHIREHAGTACLSLCYSMQEELPRKPRDMVYGFILEKPNIHISKEDMDKKRFDRGVIKLPHEPCDDKSDQPFDYTHLFDTSFVDPITNSEFTESWYRNLAFHFCEPRYVRKFRRSDR